MRGDVGELLQIAVRAREFHGGTPLLLLRPPPVRHVPEDALDAHDLAPRVIDRRFEHLDKGLGPIGLPVLFNILENFLRVDHPQIVLAKFLGQGRRVEVEVGLAQDLIQRLADRGAEQVVAKGEAPVQVLAEDVERQAFHERVIQRFRVAQAFLGSLALNELADLAADRREHLQQLLVRPRDGMAEEFDHAQDFFAHADREPEGRSQAAGAADDARGKFMV